MSETVFECAFGAFDLQRYPARKRELLRAWDAADEYLLQQVGELPAESRILLGNDSFGALSVALARHRPLNWSDSWLSSEACRLNLERNSFASDQVRYLDSLSTPGESFDVVLLKLPKSLALLDYQMRVLKRGLGSGVRILLGGMVKNMPSSLWRRIERYYGDVETFRAQKKARLIQVTLNDRLPDGPGSEPCIWTLEMNGRELEIFNHANVFSREGLDIGARFLIEHLPLTSQPMDIVDLGCGNGVLGLAVAALNPLARLRFLDESWMAVDSARRNLAQLADLDSGRFEFEVGDGMVSCASESCDLVICNPPFHQQHSVADAIAMRMFSHAARCLRPQGEFWVVGNRHLNYHHKLRRWFGSVENMAANRKFVILKAKLS